MKKTVLTQSILLLLIIFVSFSKGVSQDLITTSDSIMIECKIHEVSKTIIKFRKPDNSENFIETARLISIKMGDTTQVIYPENLAKKINQINFIDFKTAFRNKEYAKLLHAITTLPDAVFFACKAELTPVSRNKVISFINLLKSNKAVKYALFVHTDTIGREISNLAISQRRATYLHNFFTSNGIKYDNLVAEGKGESEQAYFHKLNQNFNRRVELRVTGIEKVKVLYSEKYTPPSSEVKQAGVKESAVTQSVITEAKTKPVVVRNKKVFAILLSGNGYYTLNPLSGGWSNSRGIGILQGFGGEISAIIYPKKRIGFTLHTGIAQWKTERRYMTENQDVIFTTNSTLQSIPLRIGARLYLGNSIYFHPQAGGQLLSLTIKNSETHPQSNAESKETAIKSMLGGGIGFEKKLGKLFFLDFGVQYFFTPNKEFNEAKENLHYGGVKIGIGFKSN
jgi:outer membrane protein OmpA-like peptidoglycan-associated protein